ncbi:NEL-type E3 ubiquitin ligase domain-containing protein [Pseudomonas sp. GW101-3H06]|uniref:NEL-type E3 ubiquitin ligase domain-containing protein n=1 Tax=Pseudomonas sp. GW101-3H06 TaxID=2751347 RepID=UPI001A91A637|nr:DUF6543 domain-containing protein [Pseudomonas sp. GW101-3H06]
MSDNLPSAGQPTAVTKSIHGPLLEKAIPDWLIQATPQRRTELKDHDTPQPDWYLRASPEQRQALNATVTASFSAQIRLDQAMAAFQDIDTFAAPLLSKALKDRFNVELDVNETLISLKQPLEMGILEIDVGTFDVLKLPLLQAALHNFEASECEDGAFDESSGFLTQKSATDDFEAVKTSLTVAQFTGLCRSLDIGAKYQVYLKDFLQPADAAAEQALRHKFIAAQKTALRAAAELALLKKDIEPADYRMILSVINGEVHPRLNGKPVWFRDLTLMKRRMTGCVVFSICEKYRYSDELILYIPNDPHHPLKRYTYSELTAMFKRRFTTGDAAQPWDGSPTAYQRFFSQFVDYADRPHYFSEFTDDASNAPLSQKLGPYASIFNALAQGINPFVGFKKLPPAEPINQQPNDDPALVPAGAPRKGHGIWSDNIELWNYLFEQHRAKVIADAQAHAVPTADVDARVRSEKLARLLNIGMLVLTAVSMFIPVFGELMMVVMTGQLLYGAFAGAVEWSEGDRKAAKAHLVELAENLALLAVTTGAGKGLAKLTAVKAEPVIESLDPVTLPNGERRLWKPDLSGYERSVALDPGVTANALGQYEVEGKTCIRLGGQLYETTYEASLKQWRIKHPTDPQAYQPVLTHNAAGAWRHTLERPLAWDRLTLMRRMGPVVEAFSDDQLLQIADVSGVSDNALRKMHLDIRLEVRERGLEGELRASVGSEQAAERKVLVRVGEGLYEARNERDEHLHGTDDLYASIQHALPDRHRQAIGLPHVAQGAQLKTKIIEHQLPRDQLRPLLRMQPRRQPFFRVPKRLSGERIGYPLSDHPDVSQWRPVFEQRVRHLYPTMSSQEMDSFIASLGDSRETTLRNREREFDSLTRTLQNWVLAIEQSPQQDARLTITNALGQAWQRRGEVDVDNTGWPQGQTIDLSNIDLQGQVEELPPLSANFSHVTHLNLSGTGIAHADGFLRHFKRLRRLNLSNNELDKMPQALTQWVHLTELDLSDNLIEFDTQIVEQLRELTHLRYLGLEGNPLKLPPDIGQMPELLILLLANTEINTWPVGLFDQPRSRTLFLDMRSNTLEIVPQVTPGSEQAEIVARTLISHEPASISPENLSRVRDYRQSVGFEPDRQFPPQGVFDSSLWKEGLTEAQWKEKQDVWADLEREPGSEPFFSELRKLSQSADALSANEAARVELCGKVWSMVEATAANTALREKLFRMAAAPTTCVDAGAQVFNAMGVEVLIVQAYDLDADEVEVELVTLARGKSRLNELGKIARKRVDELVAEGRRFPEFDAAGDLVPHVDAQGQPLEDIDEVEIHMIYPTQLAERLELPWQSREMMFRAPDVSDEMITSACEQVLEKERGPLLLERLLEQPFWVEHLERHYQELFRPLRAKGEPLLDLQAAQRAWLDSDSAEQKTHWRSEVVRLAKILGKPDSEIKPGTIMSNAQYYAEMGAIAAQEKALLAKLTGEALQRANLQ